MDILYSLHQYSDLGLLMLRLAVATIFLVHGLMKRRMWQPNPPMAGGMLQIMKFLAIVEPLAAVAIAVGLLTQIAALGCVMIMVGAIYLKMQVWKIPFRADNNTGWEFDLVLLAACAVLFVSGAGVWALDYLIWSI